LLAARVDLARLTRFNRLRDLSVTDVERYLAALAGQARNGVLNLPQPEERERLLLSIAERAGAIWTGPAGAGRIRLKLTGRLDVQAANWAIKTAKNRDWDAYRTIERFASSGQCRRTQILEYFGDDRPPKPTVRCCDVCEGGAKTLTRPSVDTRELECLKRWRSKQARGRPPYMVATDAALREMLLRRPRDTRSLLEIPGIGKVFCEQHGPSLLTLLASLAD
jgi:superfamily II DNA helicase RecQ